MENRQVPVTRLFKETVKADQRIVVHRGGARSSKSYSILQYIIYCMVHENCQILITRKTMPSLKLSVYKDFVDLLKDYGYYQYCNHSLSNNTITYTPNGSFVAFVSIDNPERIKSTQWNYIWMEEANEFKYGDYIVLKTRLSAPTKTQNKLLLSFNPISALHWIKTSVVDKEPCNEIVSTYKDNPFLDKEYIGDLENLINIDFNYWKVYGLGQWGSLEGLIFDRWETIPDLPDEYTEKDAIYGIDWGYIHPTAVVKVIKDGNSLYFKEILYQDRLTNADVMKILEKRLPYNSRLYADCAEPARIAEFRREGFNISPSVKGKNSVKDSIDFIKRHDVFITEDSPNLIKEFESYKWREDKDGNPMEEPVALNDDAIAAARYAAYTGFAKKMDFTFITSGE